MTQPKRALWLLNHTTLRAFEVPLLLSLGYEVFVPKAFPQGQANLSASVDHSYDASLSIPPEELAILNGQDFYGTLTSETISVINRRFDVAFFGFFPRQLAELVRHFRGALVLRPFGLAGDANYSSILIDELGPSALRWLEEAYGRFWFGQGYDNLSEVERGLFRRKALTLPVGLPESPNAGQWTGVDPRLLFVCPRIETSSYYRAIYQQFKAHFGDIPHVIGGGQPIAVADPQVAGFLPPDRFNALLRESRVMFYHSQEPRHLHYHPLEAVQAGLPLVFMGGGLLDRLGGVGLPGRCTSLGEAKKKIRRLLAGDTKFAKAIRESQKRLISSLTYEGCAPIWRSGLQRIANELAQARSVQVVERQRRKRIAVLLPLEYRGGSLRGAKLVAEAIEIGSVQAGEPAEVVFGHLDDAAVYSDEDFSDMRPSIKRRPFRWRALSVEDARRALIYNGTHSDSNQMRPGVSYVVPDDGIAQFTDCDLWVIISDRILNPILPVRPYVAMVYDYIRRYENFLSPELNFQFIDIVQNAQRVLVTTEFTRDDAVQFAGLARQRVIKVPILAPDFSTTEPHRDTKAPTYFLWTTNLAPHKNHVAALKALRTYYDEFDGKLDCHVTGVDTEDLFKNKRPYLEPLTAIARSSRRLANRLKIRGELPDTEYRRELSRAMFLWHPARIDNGTFSVIEGACLGVPSLSSRYPAMKEIDDQFGLNLKWSDPNDPRDMARELKSMETEATLMRSRLPTAERLAEQSIERLATSYWAAIDKCL